MRRDFACDESTVAETANGKVQGYYYHETYTFKGIPYAKAQRFQRSVPADAWDGIRDATSFGYVCPLLRQERPEGELKVPHRYWLMDEDCLNLNVWTPDIHQGKRPVMVWLHGGAYEGGSSIEQIAYDGDEMSHRGDVVVVSLNHRLNILGYLDLSPYGEKYRYSANAGSYDIIMALRWIRENISNFGGDSDNVTLFGQSGGGGKIVTLLQSPEADGLFHKGIIMSGVISPQMLNAEEGDSRFIVETLLKELGKTEEEIEDLETIPYSELAKAYEKAAPALKMEGKYVGCCPKMGTDYKGFPLTRGFRSETMKVPLIVGSVYGEFAFWKLPYDKKKMTREEGIAFLEECFGKEDVEEIVPLFEKAFPYRNPADLTCCDTFFRKPASDYIRMRCKNGGEVYAYLFDVDFPMESGKPAWHCSEIPFVFHNTHLTPYANIPDITEKLEEQIFESVIAFAKTGNPNHPGIPHWEKSTENTEPVMMFGENTMLRSNADVEFLEKMIPLSLKQFGRMMGQMDIKH